MELFQATALPQTKPSSNFMFDTLYNGITIFHLLPPDLGQFISDSLLFQGFKVQFPAQTNILMIQVVHPPTQLPVSASPIAGRNI